MYKFIFILLFIPIPSLAAIEIEVGQTSFMPQQDGVWYQNQFPHDLDLSSPSFSIGFTDKFNPWLRWHTGYSYLGKVTTYALAVPSDDLYFQHGANADEYIPVAHWYGEGYVQQLYFTLAPEAKISNFILAFEGGFTLYRPSWEIYIPDLRYCNECPYETWHQKHDPQLQLGRTFGVSIKYKKTSLVFRLTSVAAEGDQWPAIYDGNAKNISIRYEF